MTLSATGVLAGTPTAAGLVRPTVRVTDARGRTASRPLPVEVVSGGGSGDWAHRGRDGTRNPSNTGETTVGLASATQLGARWRTATIADDGTTEDWYRQPVVVGTRLHDVTGDGKMRAYDTSAAGNPRASVWATDPDPAGAHDFKGQVATAAGVLYATDTEERLVAVRASDGARLWRVPTGTSIEQSQTGVLVQGDRVVLLDSSNDLRAYSTTNGSAAWSAPVDLPNGFSSAVVATDGSRLFAVVSCRVYAVSLATGARVWDQQISGPGCSYFFGVQPAPIVADGAVLAQTNMGSVALDASTGAVRWRSSAASDSPNGVVTNGAWVFSRIGGANTTMTAVDVRTGGLVWETDDDVTGAGFAAAGDLLVARNGFEIDGFSALTGERVWDGGSADQRAFTTGPPTIAGGRIYITTYDLGIRAFGPP